METVLFLLQLILNFPVTFCIGGLCSYQISLLMSNCTSIEAMAHGRYKNEAKKRGIKFRWFYDFGSLYNIRQIMGNTVLEWFLPTIPDHVKNADGITFKTRNILSEVKIEVEENEPSSLWAQKRQRKQSTTGEDV